jgi:hypothetical protein
VPRPEWKPRSRVGGELIAETGKCDECQSRLQYSVVHEYEMSRHAQKGINCLDCHQPSAGQEKQNHHGFVIVKGHLPLATAAVAMKRSISRLCAAAQSPIPDWDSC